MFGRLIAKLGGKVFTSFITNRLKGAAEGKYGPKAQGAYNFLASHALWLGALIYVAGEVVSWSKVHNLCGVDVPCDLITSVTTTLGEVLAGLGIYVEAHNAQAPQK